MSLEENRRRKRAASADNANEDKSQGQGQAEMSQAELLTEIKAMQLELKELRAEAEYHTSRLEEIVRLLMIVAACSKQSDRADNDEAQEPEPEEGAEPEATQEPEPEEEQDSIDLQEPLCFDVSVPVNPLRPRQPGAILLGPCRPLRRHRVKRGGAV